LFAESQLQSRLKRVDGWRKPDSNTLELAQLGARWPGAQRPAIVEMTHRFGAAKSVDVYRLVILSISLP